MGFFLQRLNEVLYDKAPSAMSDNKVGAQYMCQFPPQGSQPHAEHHRSPALLSSTCQTFVKHVNT